MRHTIWRLDFRRPFAGADVEQWSTFAVIAGTVAGSLIGLLFVAVSIRIDVIAGSRTLRYQTGETLALFVTVLIVAVLLSIPGQAVRTLGVEVVVLAVVAGVSLFLLDRQAGAEPGIGEVLDNVNPNMVTSVLLLASGILLLFGVRDGIYVLVPAVIASTTGGIYSAWLILVKLTN
jgi:hypothetical protein